MSIYEMIEGWSGRCIQCEYKKERTQWQRTNLMTLEHPWW